MSPKTIQKFDIAYSIGNTCGAAMYLRRHMMRFAAGPFDWLAGGSFHTRAEAILSEFKDFLNREDLELRERDFDHDLVHEHDYYYNNRNQLRHYHDFKAGMPLSETFPAVQNKYQRRINRFLNDLRQSKVLLIWFSLNESTTDTDLLQYCRQIIQKYGRNIHFLIIEHSKDSDIIYRRLDDNVEHYQSFLQTQHRKGPFVTLGDVTKVNKILKRYIVRNSRMLLFKKIIYKFAARILTSVVPNKRMRRELRRKLYSSDNISH